MDILKCYQILDLNYGASKVEARRAYIRMVKTWHPDRFNENPALKKEAEKTLKEINTAYAEIKSFLSVGRRIGQREKGVPPSRESVKSLCRKNLTVKRLVRDLCFHGYSNLNEAGFRSIFRGVLSSKSAPAGMAVRGVQRRKKQPGRMEAMGRIRDNRTTFSDVFEAAAQAKKEEKLKKFKGRFSKNE